MTTTHSHTFFSEATLPGDFERYITPFWQQNVTLSRFIGKNGISVSYAYCLPEHAHSTVVISSGRVESLLKYQEVIYDLYHRGFAVFIADHRGQGLSDRMRPNPQLGFVTHFNEYVFDLQYFLTNVVMPNKRGEVNLLCHSMGSAIGALTILSLPNAFSRAVFCAPMFGIRPALPGWLGTLLVQVNRIYNKIKPGSSGYFFGQRDYHEEVFATNRLTGSEVRYQLFRRLYAQQPALQLGGVSPEWLAAASQAMWRIEQHAESINLPLLVFSAELDTVVDNRRQQRVAKTMPNATVITVPGAQHELLIEQDSIRHPIMEHIIEFFCHRRMVFRRHRL